MIQVSTKSVRVSVVIAAYNMERYICETLESVRRQTMPSLEVIVVDDCSTDSTPSVIEKFCALDDRFSYVRTTKNSNLPAHARNVGIKRAQGEYIAFLDHDDLWLPWKLERQIMLMDARPELAMVHSHLWDFTSNSKALGWVFLPDPLRRRSPETSLARSNSIQCSSAMVRTEILKSEGGFDERMELRTVEDYHLWLRIARKHKIAYISEVHGFYRWLRSGASRQSNLSEKHDFLDQHEGTNIAGGGRSWWRRTTTKLCGYPRALYFHLLDGEIRRRFSLRPRTWE